jgi:hypothetical protein
VRKLSLSTAVDGAEGGAPCSPQRTWAENDVFECFYSLPQLFSLEQLFARTAKAFEGGYAPSFRPTDAIKRCCDERKQRRPRELKPKMIS